MGKSGVFDSTFLVLQMQFCLLEMSPNTVLFAGDVKSEYVCFAFEELSFDSVVIFSWFQCWWAVLNCAFQLSSLTWSCFCHHMSDSLSVDASR